MLSARILTYLKQRLLDTTINGVLWKGKDTHMTHPTCIYLKLLSKQNLTYFAINTFKAIYKPNNSS